ncbi:hypothetical protein [Hyphococcus luteus]|uniref:Uncharacterized protein n=1 Tax=Hyphococcus luteus TaxID=2058213 RepID=A0A2S7K2K6_9PROT|nr:hypothetical protein [Marinicaulis flavus]PQA86727.1 hypothetical protein CW354_14655 [Marinicaulis flavus]
MLLASTPRQMTRLLLWALFFGLSLFALTKKTVAADRANNTGCEIYEYDLIAELDENSDVRELLAVLRPGWKTYSCKRDKIGFVHLATPILTNDGVSSYTLYSLHPKNSANDEAAVEDYFIEAVFDMMMVNPSNEEVSHLNSRFAETSFVTTGAFKNIHRLWTDIIRDTRNKNRMAELSGLGQRERGLFQSFIEEIEKQDAWRLSALYFSQSDEYVSSPSRYTVEISSGKKLWRIDFDFTDFDEIALQNIDHYEGDVVLVEEFDD